MLPTVSFNHPASREVVVVSATTVVVVEVNVDVVVVVPRERRISMTSPIALLK